MACGDNRKQANWISCLLVAQIGECYDVATLKQYHSVGIIACKWLDMTAK
jgi:hypothetical protein